MKFLVTLFSVLLSTSVVLACERASTTLTNQPSTQLAANTSPGPIYTTKNCSFRANPKSGRISADIHGAGYDGPDSEWSFSFHCYTGESQNYIDQLLYAKKVKNNWVWSADESEITPAERFKTYQFHGKNWAGRVVAFNEITGDEDRRVRTFSFCLFEFGGPQVLCGQVQEPLHNKPVGAQFQQALAVLKTIVFVDQPTASSSAPAASASAP